MGVRRRPARAGDRDRRARADDGEPIITDGPFAETKEQLGGFWIIEAPDLDAALAWAAQGLGRVHGTGRGPPVPERAPAA